MKIYEKYCFIFLVVALFLIACNGSAVNKNSLFFSLLPEEKTHIDFDNKILKTILLIFLPTNICI